MMTRDEVEAEIRRLIATETDAVRFSNKLFTPGGLFSRLHSTPAEKQAVIDSPLFDEANRRLSELEMLEDNSSHPALALVNGVLSVEPVPRTPSKS